MTKTVGNNKMLIHISSLYNQSHYMLRVIYHGKKKFETLKKCF